MLIERSRRLLVTPMLNHKFAFCFVVPEVITMKSLCLAAFSAIYN
jgi:hypothetical protein